jgi:hypothetical protein
VTAGEDSGKPGEPGPTIPPTPVAIPDPTPVVLVNNEIPAVSVDDIREYRTRIGLPADDASIAKANGDSKERRMRTDDSAIEHGVRVAGFPSPIPLSDMEQVIYDEWTRAVDESTRIATPVEESDDSVLSVQMDENITKPAVKIYVQAQTKGSVILASHLEALGPVRVAEVGVGQKQYRQILVDFKSQFDRSAKGSLITRMESAGAELYDIEFDLSHGSIKVVVDVKTRASDVALVELFQKHIGTLVPSLRVGVFKISVLRVNSWKANERSTNGRLSNMPLGIGGLRLKVGNPPGSNQAWCTSNASVRIGNDDYLVTAGHCFVRTVNGVRQWLPDGSNVYHDDILIGNFVQARSRNATYTDGSVGVDYAFVRLRPSSPATEYFHVSNGYYQLESLVGPPAVFGQVPQVLCFEGSSPAREPAMATTCGSYNGYGTYYQQHRMSGGNICGGDSGGMFRNGGLLVGILSQGTDNLGGSCGSTNWFTLFSDVISNEAGSSLVARTPSREFESVNRFSFRNLEAGMCLDSDALTPRNGAVVQYTCGSVYAGLFPYQRWSLEPRSNSNADGFWIRRWDYQNNTNGYCLDLSYGNVLNPPTPFTSPNAIYAAYQYQCDGPGVAGNQVFKFTTASAYDKTYGFYRVEVQDTSLDWRYRCLESPGPTVNQSLRFFACGGSNSQKWFFVKA